MTNDPFAFHGKVAIITGGTRGIGFATARLLGLRGAKIVLASRKADACARAEAALQAEGIDARAVPGHAAKAGDIQRLVETALAAFGGIDIAIANAGVNPVFDPLTEVAEDSWAKIIDTNVSGPLHLARLALPHIAERRGAMVMVSSINAGFGIPQSGAYGISKAALEQMTRQLAVEWGVKGVRVNAVSPGTTRTDMIRALAEQPDFIRSIEQRSPLHRLGEAADVAAAIAFLASDAARHITGQVLRVDGGETIARGL